MGLFDKKRALSRPQLKKAFRESSGVIPRTGGKKFTRKERENMTRDVFGWKYGSEISRKDYRSAVEKLELERGKTKDRVQRKAFDGKIRYLRKLGGMEKC